MSIPNVGDIYLLGSNQIVIFVGPEPTVGVKVITSITAIFGEWYSQNFGVTTYHDEYYNQVTENKNCLYIGNLSDIFRKIL